MTSIWHTSVWLLSWNGWQIAMCVQNKNFSTSLFNVDKLRFDFQFASVTVAKKNTFQLNLCAPIFTLCFFFCSVLDLFSIDIDIDAAMCEWYDWQNGIIQLTKCLQMILIIIVAAVDSNDFNYRESLVMRWIIKLERDRETERKTDTNCKTPRIQKRNTIFACYFFRVIQFCSHFITFYWVTPSVITFCPTVQYSAHTNTAHETQRQPQPSGDSWW